MGLEETLRQLLRDHSSADIVRKLADILEADGQRSEENDGEGTGATFFDDAEVLRFAARDLFD